VKLTVSYSEIKFKELTLNPSLGKRGTLGSPFSFQEKGFGDEFLNYKLKQFLLTVHSCKNMFKKRVLYPCYSGLPRSTGVTLWFLNRLEQITLLD
jgi:hypothetical protein